ncbi:MAG: indole-3-glycerol phosphate synthase TrpC [Actinobacteria bacterium]|nr:indole-3-glycerol phosphate synthase TrpC [Actinomycetota bacterium]
MVVATYLDAILERHRREAASDQRDLGELRRSAENCEPRGFISALRSESTQLAVIADIKRHSPSAGDLFADLSPSALAAEYEAGGARCLSVLTEGPAFHGSPDDLREARHSCSLPVLRKDFTVCERDVLDAAVMGADAILLIAAALTHEELLTLSGLADNLGLDVLLELHDEADLAVLSLRDWAMVGVNRRDLVSFTIDQDRAAQLYASLPGSALRVAESGMRSTKDAQDLASLGFEAVLIGELFVKSPEPRLAVAEIASTAR